MQGKAKIPYIFYDDMSEEDVSCFILVQHYLKVPPDPYTWDSDWDYYGYEEIEYTLLDEENNELDVDIDDSIDEKIMNEIREYFEDDLM
jgi:hypothetical protein